MRTLLFLALILLSGNGLFSQVNLIPENWAPNPSIHKIEDSLMGESAVVLLDKKRLEYIDIDGKLAAFKTIHVLVHINDDKGIESYNKIFLGVSENNDILDIKARTILPNGKIKELNRSDIKDYKDEDGDVFKIFAMEGLEKGCEIEYLYTYKRPVSFFIREQFKNRLPVMHAQVELICPDRLVFDNKLYNATGVEATVDTSISEKRIYRFILKNQIGAEEEKYSFYQAQLPRVEFKLSYNLSRERKERLFTWNELAGRVYEIYTVTDEKEKDRIKELIRKQEWGKLLSEKDKIAKIEHFIKANVATRTNADGPDVENIEKILKNKLANQTGIMKLYGEIYTQMGIPFQYVLTGDRTGLVVERSFENWNNADNPLLYFPNQKKFISPTKIEMRFPWIDPDWAGTLALFCNVTKIGDYVTAIGEVKMVPLENWDQSAINLDASVKLSEDNQDLIINLRQIYKGYPAAVYRTAFAFNNEEDRKNITKELVKFGTNSENIISSKLENEALENYNENLPFVLQAEVKANELMEKAGNKLLIRIGDVIGPQVEMYQEKPRQFPMELHYPHVLDRKIRFEIPKGFRIKNLDDLNIRHVHPASGEPTMSFVSSYKVENNLLTIQVIEEYRKTYYPLREYEIFKQIINAAADFNKIALILEKAE